jgi:hypothetical protein
MDDFSNIKVGDVFFTRDGFTSRLVRHKVTHVTATQFHIGSVKYRKSDGYRIGYNGWDSPAIIATDAVVAKYRDEKVEDKARAAIAVAIRILERARGDDAVRIAALLPPELTEVRNG